MKSFVREKHVWSINRNLFLIRLSFVWWMGKRIIFSLLFYWIIYKKIYILNSQIVIIAVEAHAIRNSGLKKYTVVTNRWKQTQFYVRVKWKIEWNANCFTKRCVLKELITYFGGFMAVTLNQRNVNTFELFYLI